MSDKEAYRELLIDKTKRVEGLVRKAKDILGIDEETGEAVILVSRAKLRDEDLIGLHLIGRFFASELGLVESPSLSRQGLARKTGTKETVVSARLHDLNREGYIRSPKRGEHEIVFPRIGEFLDLVRERVGISS